MSDYGHDNQDELKHLQPRAEEVPESILPEDFEDDGIIENGDVEPNEYHGLDRLVKTVLDTAQGIPQVRVTKAGASTFQELSFSQTVVEEKDDKDDKDDINEKAKKSLTLDNESEKTLELKPAQVDAEEAPAEELDAPDAEELDAPDAEELDAPDAEELDAPDAEELDAPGAEELDAPGAEELDAPGAEELDAAADVDVVAEPTGVAGLIQRFQNLIGLGNDGKAPVAPAAPEPVAEPEPAPEPAYELAPEPASELASEPASELAPEPASELAYEPAPEPEPTPAADPSVEPAQAAPQPGFFRRIYNKYYLGTPSDGNDADQSLDVDLDAPAREAVESAEQPADSPDADLDALARKAVESAEQPADSPVDLDAPVREAVESAEQPADSPDADLDAHAQALQLLDLLEGMDSLDEILGGESAPTHHSESAGAAEAFAMPTTTGVDAEMPTDDGSSAF